MARCAAERAGGRKGSEAVAKEDLGKYRREVVFGREAGEAGEKHTRGKSVLAVYRRKRREVQMLRALTGSGSCDYYGFQPLLNISGTQGERESERDACKETERQRESRPGKDGVME